MTLIADVFLRLRTPKNVVTSMSKKSRITLPFGEQQGKRVPTLLKSEWQHFHQIYWSMWKQLTYKKFLLVICKILRLFVNRLSADGKYSLLNRDNLTQPIQLQFSQKQKKFSQFFLCIFQIEFKWPSKLMYFWGSGRWKAWFDQGLKSRVWEYPSRERMVNGPNHCCILNDTTFTRLIDQCEGNRLTKSLS